jgi:hypothetical protein
VLRVNPVWSLTAVIVTFGIPAPELSVTSPLMPPVVVCASIGAALTKQKHNMATMYLDMRRNITRPLFRETTPESASNSG